MTNLVEIARAWRDKQLTKDELLQHLKRVKIYRPNTDRDSSEELIYFIGDKNSLFEVEEYIFPLEEDKTSFNEFQTLVNSSSIA